MVVFITHGMQIGRDGEDSGAGRRARDVMITGCYTQLMIIEHYI